MGDRPFHYSLVLCSAAWMQRLRQEGCYKFQASLGYKVRPLSQTIKKVFSQLQHVETGMPGEWNSHMLVGILADTTTLENWQYARIY